MHLFTLGNWSEKRIIDLIKKASNFSFKPYIKNSPFQHLMVGILFFEPSTRTKFSFEYAAKMLGAKTLSFNGSKNTAVTKGESVYDTVKTFVDFGADVIVTRHWEEEYYKQLYDIKVPIFSGGDGIGSHPTQALTDLLTIYNEFKSFEGIKIAIVGDVKHSRVAKSNIRAMQRLGMEVMTVGPNEFVWDTKLNVDFHKALAWADVVMILRPQLERVVYESFTKKDYHAKYGLNEKNITLLQKHAIFMHPSPVTYGVEIAESLRYHPKSRISNQVSNGVLIRGTLLEEVLTKCQK